MSPDTAVRPRPAPTRARLCALVPPPSFNIEDEERNPDGLFFDEGARERLIEFLRILSQRRTELVATLTREANTVEAEIERLEANGDAAEAAYEALEGISERLDALGPRGPWPICGEGPQFVFSGATRGRSAPRRRPGHTGPERGSAARPEVEGRAGAARCDEPHATGQG
jgi:hypothetical protein